MDIAMSEGGEEFVVAFRNNREVIPVTIQTEP